MLKECYRCGEPTVLDQDWCVLCRRTLYRALIQENSVLKLLCVNQEYFKDIGFSHEESNGALMLIELIILKNKITSENG